MPDLVSPADPPNLIQFFEEHGRSRLPGLLGIEIIELAAGRCRLRLDVTERHQAPNGYLHAASVVALADTAAGYGTVASLPEGAVGFTTLELKTNFLSTVLEGGIAAEARLSHGGRTTQVWDAEVFVESTLKKLALFRCTQVLLYPNGR